MPESGPFSDWIGNNADDLRCSDWPKWRHPLVVVDFSQPRPQGLLAFQYGGGRREDPGTQQKSRDWFVHEEWKFIQNGGQDKEWEDLGTRSWIETGEKQTKWRQRQTQKKLKIWKNALTSHRNTVEWYSDLIFCSMTFICFNPERSVAYTALDTDLFSLFTFFAHPECQRFSFLFSWKEELFLTVSAIYFILGISRTDLRSQGIFCHDALKPLPFRNSTKH